jgi:hypothetical protein
VVVVVVVQHDVRKMGSNVHATERYDDTAGHFVWYTLNVPA